MLPLYSVYFDNSCLSTYFPYQEIDDGFRGRRRRRSSFSRGSAQSQKSGSSRSTTRLDDDNDDDDDDSFIQFGEW